MRHRWGCSQGRSLGCGEFHSIFGGTERPGRSQGHPEEDRQSLRTQRGVMPPWANEGRSNGTDRPGVATMAGMLWPGIEAWGTDSHWGSPGRCLVGEGRRMSRRSGAPGWGAARGPHGCGTSMRSIIVSGWCGHKRTDRAGPHHGIQYTDEGNPERSSLIGYIGRKQARGGCILWPKNGGTALRPSRVDLGRPHVLIRPMETGPDPADPQERPSNCATRWGQSGRCGHG